MSESIKTYLTEDEVNNKIKELGKQISKDYEGQEVVLAIVLKGASMFGCELAKRITVPTYLDFMTVSSYGSGTVSSGEVKIKKDLDTDIEGKHVIIVEDIIDSGNTLFRLRKLLQERNAASVSIATLLSKPDRREVEVDVDYIGYIIPDEFVVGYGLDYDQKYRNLPYIGVVEFN